MSCRNPSCHDGIIDTGGQNPDGSWINIPCPDCQIAALHRQLAEAQAIVAQLPLDAQGKTCIPQVTQMFHADWPDAGEWDWDASAECWNIEWVATNREGATVMHNYGTGLCYRSRDAAEAAKGGKP